MSRELGQRELLPPFFAYGEFSLSSNPVPRGFFCSIVDVANTNCCGQTNARSAPPREMPMEGIQRILLKLLRLANEAQPEPRRIGG